MLIVSRNFGNENGAVERAVMDIAFLKESLVQVVGTLQFVLETASVICVLIGFVKTVYIGVRSRQGFVLNTEVKLTFGRWLAMALEFQLAADILNTTVDPDIEGLIKLFGIALIRTFLNYFLTKEIEMQGKSSDLPCVSAEK